MKPYHYRSLAGCAAIGLLIAGIFAVGAQAPGRPHPEKPPRGSHGTGLEGLRQQVEQGKEEDAIEYYRNTVAPQTGFPFENNLTETSVAKLLQYLKYPELTVLDLHTLSSAELMAKGQEGEILATRFFAPKITDVTHKTVAPPVPAGGFGWRKLVRVKARPQSAADNNGVEMAWFLQNITDEDVAENPFDPKRRVSKFNQVILTRKGAPATGQRGGWFLTFGPLVKEDKGVPVLTTDGQFQVQGFLNYGLDATFDEANRDPESNSAAKTYFVPLACAACHGGQNKPKVNYLDTDHWFDRVTPAYGIAPADGAHFQQEDFTGLAASPHGVIYDGGKDRTTDEGRARFKAAFEVIRKLNQEIVTQNTNAQAQFQRRAVEKWLKNHLPNDAQLPPDQRGFGDEHVPPYKRAFGNAPWQEDKPEHRKMIYYFNRYCYRCHSSVAYHVMDRDGVLSVLDTMPERLVERQNALRWMPQDRFFPGLLPNPMDPPQGNKLPGIPSGQLEEFLKLLDGLGQE